MVRCFVAILFIQIYAISAFSQSCEEARAQQLAYSAAGCGPSQCYNSDYKTYCETFYSIFLRRAVSDHVEYEVVCPYTWTEDTNYPGFPPTHESGTRELSMGYVGDCNSNSAPKSGSSGPHQCTKKGSIVHVENQSLAEIIPIIGVPFSLVYSTMNQVGRVANFKIRMTISGDSPRDYIQSFDVETKRQGVTVDTASFLNTTSNQVYEYTWSGMDPTGSFKIPSQKFEVTLKENSPSGTFSTKSEVTVGYFDAKKIELGGWLPSIFKYYDPAAKRIYSALGVFREVEAKIYAGGLLYVADDESNVIYIFDANGRHLSTLTDFLGSTLYTFNYDSQGRLVSIGEPFGRTTTFNRNVAGALESITSPKGQVSLVSLNANGYIATVTNPNSEAYNMTYLASNGLLGSFQKPGGQTSSFNYDANGLLLEDSHSGGYFFTLAKTLNNASDYDISINSSMSRMTQIKTLVGSNNSASRTVTSPSGQVEIFSFNYANGFGTSYLSNQGITRTVSYADDQRFGSMRLFPQSSSYSESNAGSRSYTNTQNISLSNSSDPFSIVSWARSSQLDGSNAQVVTNYNPSTKVFSSATFLNKTMEVGIDSSERVVTLKKGSLNAVTFSYTNENLTSISQGTRSTALGYNATSGFLESITNPLSQTTGFMYNSAGRVTSKILPDSRVIGFGYDANGNITSITPPGRPAHVFSINAHEIVGTYAPPALSGVSVVNTAYQYNLDKQITQITRPEGSTIDFNYNSTTGVLESFVTPDGTYTQTMDSTNGLPSTINQPDGSWTSISYAGTSMIGSTNYDTSSSLIGSYAPTYSSVALVESDSVTNPLGIASTINYLYNDDEDLTKAGDLTLNYNTPNGQLTGTSIGTGTSAITDTYTYNNYGEVTDYVAKRGTTTIYSLTLARDASGRINGKTQTMNATTDAFEYTFDVTGRLTETKKNTATVATYNYDTNSNRNGGAIGAQPTTASYDDQDRLTTYNTLSFTYNANGDLTSKTNNTLGQTTQYTYDVFGNLKQVQLPGGPVIDYEVDALNRRIGKKVNGVLQKRWVYMDQYRIAAELNATGAITKRFVYGSKTNIPDYMIVGSTKYRIISDHLGSPRLVVKMSDGSIAQRMDHDEFGRVTVNTNPDTTPFGFAGGLYDHQTSLVRFGARDYDPEVGRWTAKDPILFGGGDANLFGYVFLDPINFVDPKGLWGLQIGIGFSGFIFTAGTGFNGGLAIVHNDQGFHFNWYTTGQFNGGLGFSFGRGIQASVTPNAQCMEDLGGTSVGVGFDSPFVGASVSQGSVGPTYGLSGPSLGWSIFGFTSSTQIGAPVVVNPLHQK